MVIPEYFLTIIVNYGFQREESEKKVLRIPIKNTEDKKYKFRGTISVCRYFTIMTLSGTDTP